MTRIFHVSDIHFGAEDTSALDWFANCVRTERPDAVALTGDLTMRARHREFAAAAKWLGQFDVPMTIEPGNHDLPYFNLFERFFRPYRRYRALENHIEQQLELDGVTIVPLGTTARAQWRLNWSHGKVSSSALRSAISHVDASPDGHILLVACHHPLVDADLSQGRTRGGRKALGRLAKAGAHAVLSGHVHDPFDLVFHGDDASIRMIGAGTLSERTRETRPSFNEIRVENGSIDAIVRLQD